MKNTAFIINAARGAVIDEAAMIEAPEVRRDRRGRPGCV